MNWIIIDTIIAWVLVTIANFLPKDKLEASTTFNTLAITWLCVAVFLLAKKVG